MLKVANRVNKRWHNIMCGFRKEYSVRLKIENFAKIKNADIAINGITVIAGENNTGKSTVGKIVFSLYKSLVGIEDKIEIQREKEIMDMCQLMLKKYMIGENSFQKIILERKMIVVNIARAIRRYKEKNENIKRKEIEKIIIDIVKKNKLHSTGYEDDFNIEIITNIINNIDSILKLPDNIVFSEVLSRYFKTVFHSQINSLQNKDSTAKLKLQIKEKEIELLFRKDRCVDCSLGLHLLSNVIYIDNPFIIDKLSRDEVLDMMEQLLKDSLTFGFHNNVMDNIFGSILAKEKLSEIYKILGEVVNGKIQEKNEKFYFHAEDMNQPISIENLSTGLKSFVVLKMLIENGRLEKKDVLILDEPEIHLHPKWQIVYAELIVLLQKYFDLSIIVTTHSPYFLDAIDLYSVKHGLKEKVNYYLSSIVEDGVEMKEVDVDAIYKKMASPIQTLETLRYELNNQ